MPVFCNQSNCFENSQLSSCCALSPHSLRWPGGPAELTMAGLAPDLDELVKSKELTAAIQGAQQSGSRALASEIAFQARVTARPRALQDTVPAGREGLSALLGLCRRPRPLLARPRRPSARRRCQRLRRAATAMLRRATCTAPSRRSPKPRRCSSSPRAARTSSWRCCAARAAPRGRRRTRCSTRTPCWRPRCLWRRTRAWTTGPRCAAARANTARHRSYHTLTPRAPQKLCLAYLDDLFGARLWCNDDAAARFVEALQTAFPDVTAAPGRAGAAAVPSRGALGALPADARYRGGPREQLRLSFFQRFQALQQGGLQKEAAAKLEPVFALAARCALRRSDRVWRQVTGPGTHAVLLHSVRPFHPRTLTASP